LSTVPGSSTARAGESEKLQALQTKLSESEETVASLKTELETVNEKLSQLSISAEAPSGDASATEATRAEQHTLEIERLTSAHMEELQALKDRLEEAETQRKELEESSQKELEEARQSASAQGDEKTVSLLDELKETHKIQLEAIEQELVAHKASAAHFGEQINALNNELELQKSALEEEKARALEHLERDKRYDLVMEKLNTEIVELRTLKEKEVRAAEQNAEEKVSALQEQVTSLEEKLAAAESATKENPGQTSSIAEKDQEIIGLQQALEKVHAELQEARGSAVSELDSKIEELGSAHQAAIAQLKIEHDAAISSLSAAHAEKLTLAEATAESSGTEHTNQLQELRDALEISRATAKKDQEDAIAELKIAHDVELKSLQEKLEASETTAKKGQEDSINELKIAHDVELKSLQEKLEASEITAQKGQEDAINELKIAHDMELKSLQEKLEASETALNESRRALDEGNASAQDVAVQEIDALRHKCESLESQLTTGTGKINALLEEMQSKQAEAEAIHRTLLDCEDHAKKESAQKDNKMRALEEKAAEAIFLLDQHTAQAADVSEQHQKALDGLNSTHATRVQSIESELKAALDDHAGEIASHTDEYTKLQKQFEETKAELQAELAKLQISHQDDAEAHAKQIAELQVAFEETKVKLQAELEAAQTSKAASADSDAEHGKAIEQLLTMHESKLSSLRKELESSNESKIEELQRAHDAALANANEKLDRATAIVQDTSALDSLKATIADLESKLADSEKARITVQESATSAESRYAALNKEYQATIAQVTELQQSALDSTSQKSHLEHIMKQLSESRDQLLKAKADNAAISDALVDCKTQNKTLTEKVEADERDLNNQIDKNMSLLEKLGAVDSDISASRRRVRELETELAVLKADSGDKSSSSGLGASRWATADEGSENAEDGGQATTEGEDLGPSIEGTVGDPRLKKSSYSSDLPAFHPFI
jgi:chromosome segregation ATPase